MALSLSLVLVVTVLSVVLPQGEVPPWSQSAEGASSLGMRTVTTGGALPAMDALEGYLGRLGQEEPWLVRVHHRGFCRAPDPLPMERLNPSDTPGLQSSCCALTGCFRGRVYISGPQFPSLRAGRGPRTSKVPVLAGRTLGPGAGAQEPQSPCLCPAVFRTSQQLRMAVTQMERTGEWRRGGIPWGPGVSVTLTYLSPCSGPGTGRCGLCPGYPES